MTDKIRLQREIFLNSEGDAWFDRNHESLLRREQIDDPVYSLIKEVYPYINNDGRIPNILEIGCGEGRRLKWLASELGANVSGLDPSSKAVAEALSHGIDSRCGTANLLPWEDRTFDIVIFGFCLYLCDLEDLFSIAAEADRVLRSSSFMIIHDFYSSNFTRQAYHHKEGIYSNKMDFRRLFDWHPAYTCYSHRIIGHSSSNITDDEQEWVSISLLRKSPIGE